MSPRYAIYFAPDKASAWWRFGTHWLGRDAYGDRPLPQPQALGIAPEALRELTAEPRRYGFHATLKAPFRLAADHDETSLLLRLEALASTLSPVALGPLHAVVLGDFVALVPTLPSTELQTLAANCVTQLDDLRAPLRPDELARRQAAGLDPRAMELLHSYGYPHVLERFRFHMTLTGPADKDSASQVMRAVSPDIHQLNLEAPLELDRLCLFVEPSPGTAFRRLDDVLLASPRPSAQAGFTTTQSAKGASA